MLSRSSATLSPFPPAHLWKVLLTVLQFLCMSRPSLSCFKCQSYPRRDDSRGLFRTCCLSGRVISPLGGSRDGGPPIHSDASLHPMPILSAAPPAMRDWDHTVTGQKRIFSGLAAIDFFYPLARGHRMALAGPACVIRTPRLLVCLIRAQYGSIALLVTFCAEIVENPQWRSTLFCINGFTMSKFRWRLVHKTQRPRVPRPSRHCIAFMYR